MPLFGRKKVNSTPHDCPLCKSPVELGDLAAHLRSHTSQIPPGREGPGGWTWICSCGPASGCWEKQKGAEIALIYHVHDRHGLPLPSPFDDLVTRLMLQQQGVL